jgi:hypothetical protein
VGVEDDSVVLEVEGQPQRFAISEIEKTRLVPDLTK